MDCTWDNNNTGCQGGEVDFAFTSMIHNNLFIAYESDYPYLGVSGMCMSDPQYYTPAGTVDKCWKIARRTETVKKALYKFGPLAISIGVTESMLLYNGGVFDDQTCSGALDDLDHSVVLTGWKVIDGKEAWEVKNSWSTWWGDNGYIYIQSENQEWNCGVTTDAVAVEVLPFHKSES
jgi:C1A family cysteine protease